MPFWVERRDKDDTKRREGNRERVIEKRKRQRGDRKPI